MMCCRENEVLVESPESGNFSLTHSRLVYIAQSPAKQGRQKEGVEVAGMAQEGTQDGTIAGVAGLRPHLFVHGETKLWCKAL